MTRQTTEFVYVTFIAAPPEAIWAAITTPEVARRYWGHANVSDWSPGATWSHVRDDGKVQITGHVLEAEAPHRLVISWANPERASDPLAVSRVTFELTQFPGMVRLTVTHDELEAGGSMAQGISKGWPIVLSSLKSYLETGQALDVFAKPLP